MEASLEAIHLIKFVILSLSKDQDDGGKEGVSDHVWGLEEVVALLDK